MTLTHAKAIQIVVIEDSDEDAELTMRALRHGHISNPIIRLRDGQEALQFLMADQSARQRIRTRRLVVLDLAMPKANGIDVLRSLRANAVTKSLPVVMLTGSNSPSDRLESEALGVDRYFVKPLLPNAVADMVAYAESYWKTERP